MKYRYRIVRVGTGEEVQYYVQRRLAFGPWSFVCKYQEGTDGPFSYQFCAASNPFYHVEYTIPNLIGLQKPILNIFFRSQCPPKPGPINLILEDLEAIQAAIHMHRVFERRAANPYPSVDILKEYGEKDVRV